jgi:hypothetical protein
MLQVPSPTPAAAAAAAVTEGSGDSASAAVATAAKVSHTHPIKTSLLIAGHPPPTHHQIRNLLISLLFLSPLT